VRATFISLAVLSQLPRQGRLWWGPATRNPRHLDPVQPHLTAAGKFMGDGVMAFWNSPGDVEDHAAAACRSALAQQA
jgi:hypothetical protein